MDDEQIMEVVLAGLREQYPDSSPGEQLVVEFTVKRTRELIASVESRVVQDPVSPSPSSEGQ